MTMLFPYSKYKVHGHSMLPTIKPGQDVLVFKWAYLFSKPKRGDIVVIKVDGKEMIKRIQMSSDRGTFVIGDNRKDSLDSRKLGAVNKEQIIGKVIWY